MVESFSSDSDLKAEDKAALKKKQHGEVLRFRNHCAVQQELLHALVNKALFTLLVEQQTQLALIGFPRFSNTFVDKLKSYMQNRLKNASKTEYEAALVQQVTSQRELLCAFLSVRLTTVSVERSRAAQLARPRLSRAASIDHDSEIASDPNYFDAEAKKLRKRRRIITQHHNDSYSHSGVSSYGSYDSPRGGGGGGGASLSHDSPPGQYPYADYSHPPGGSYARPRQQDSYYPRVDDGAGGYYASQGPGGRGRGGRYHGASGGVGSFGGRGGLQVVPLGGGRGGRGRGGPVWQQGGGPPQGGVSRTRASAVQTFDAPLQNNADNPALPMLQKLASLIQPKKK